MNIYVVDDEPLSLGTMKRLILKGHPDAQVHLFSDSVCLMDKIRTSDEKPDIVFSDIEMPDVDGFDIAMGIKSISPGTRIVFVTGYSQYALEAYRNHIHGYILKPVTAEQINEEIELIDIQEEIPVDSGNNKIVVRCFGPFDVFWNNEPIAFSRSKTRELLAYLIDRRGEFCTAGEIISALWEDDDIKKRTGYLRAITSDLKNSLKAIGMEDVLIRKHKMWAVKTAMLDCDYYKMLEGDLQAVNSYAGEYMSRYSWAENTCALLFMKYNK